MDKLAKLDDELPLTVGQVFDNFTYDAANILSALKIILHELCV